MHPSLLSLPAPEPSDQTPTADAEVASAASLTRLASRQILQEAVNDITGAEGPVRRRILGNVVLLALAFMLHFTAYFGVCNLQSTLNAEKGLGTAALATVYGSLILSSIFLPSLVIRWLGCKWTMVATMVLYMPYIAAHFHTTWATLLPAAALTGTAGGPLWCAEGTYVAASARAYVRADPRRPRVADVVMVRFMGYFFLLFQLAQVWGNLISSVVFSTGAVAGVGNSKDVGSLCGANFYAPLAVDGNGTVVDRPPAEQVYIVAGTYLCCMALAVAVVAAFVESLAKYSQSDLEGGGAQLNGVQLLTATLKLLRQRNMQLLFPIIVFLGFEQAFVVADFTSAFVSCAWGIQYIGYVMMCYGAATAAAALVCGWVVQLTGRLPVVLCAAAGHAALFLTVRLWRPQPQQYYPFFIIATLWGACDGVWIVQVNGLCGILFHGDEAAGFSNLRVWESVGYIVGYSYSAYLIAYVKIYVLMGLWAIAVSTYVAIEMNENKRLEEIKSTT